jgi:beta-lactamase regulating signal transducer with metallopeptidase domain
MNIVTDVLGSSLIERLGWVLLHSIWQVALIAAVFTIAIRAMAHLSANARYAVGCVALLLMIAVPLITFFLVTTPIHDESVVHVAATGSVPDDSHDSADAIVSNPIWEKPESAIAPNRISPMVGPSDNARMSEMDYPLAEDIKPAEAARPAAQPISFVQRTRSVLPLAVTCWLAGAIILMFRPALGLFATQRMRRVGVQPVSRSVLGLAERLGTQIGLKRSVQVVRSTVVSVPAAIGVLRPMILLPVSVVSGLTPDQLASVIAHELAHIRRHDFLVNAMQTVVEAFLFYHPLAWRVSRRVRQEREYCCDDEAVAACGNLTNYAQALLIVDQLRGDSPQLALSAAGGSIRHRIRRLMGKPMPTDTSRGLCLAGLLLILGVGFYLFLAYLF